MRTLLLITYHWPPSGGAGVHRWLKMSRYLPAHGWRVVVFTPENPERPVVDDSLQQDPGPHVEVLRGRLWEPYGLYKTLLGRERDAAMYSGLMLPRDAGRRERIMQRVGLWVRGNLLIPDARRFWIRPALRELERHWSAIGADVVVTTGPPHSTHLIGKRLAARRRVPWVADFRDPWTGIDFVARLGLTPPARWWHERLEAAVITSATRVVTVTPGWARDFERMFGRPVDLVMNGFDPQDFAGEIDAPVRPRTLCYFGSMDASRDCPALWQALATLRAQGVPGSESLRVELHGAVDGSIIDSVHAHGVEDQVAVMPYRPHADAVRAMRRSALLLLVINRGGQARSAIPGKCYEYLAARRPVLLIGDTDADAASLLRDLDAGCSAGHDDVAAVTGILRDFLSQGGAPPPTRADIDAYSRASLAAQYADLLDAACSPGPRPR